VTKTLEAMSTRSIAKAADQARGASIRRRARDRDNAYIKTRNAQPSHPLGQVILASIERSVAAPSTLNPKCVFKPLGRSRTGLTRGGHSKSAPARRISGAPPMRSPNMIAVSNLSRTASVTDGDVNATSTGQLAFP
jgi:hypothetical protein